MAKKANAGKQAMFNESKKLESKGKKQVAKQAPDKAEEDPMMGKGMKAMFGKMGPGKAAPGKGKEKEMPKPKAKKKAK